MLKWPNGQPNKPMKLTVAYGARSFIGKPFGRSSAFRLRTPLTFPAARPPHRSAARRRPRRQTPTSCHRTRPRSAAGHTGSARSQRLSTPATAWASAIVPQLASFASPRCSIIVCAQTSSRPQQAGRIAPLRRPHRRLPLTNHRRRRPAYFLMRNRTQCCHKWQQFCRSRLLGSR
jgi:hypothetical protein